MLKSQNRQLLEQEPLFCFETAVKLLYWCGFAYEYDEVGLACMSACHAMLCCVSSQLYSLGIGFMLLLPCLTTTCLIDQV